MEPEARHPDEPAPLPPLPETAYSPDDALLTADERPARPGDAEAPEAPPVKAVALPVESEPSGGALPGPVEGAKVHPEEAEGPGAGEPLPEDAEQELEMLAFQLGSEEYAVPVELVREVLTPREVTPVPNTPDYILGVCSLRGAVLPVIDLHRRLGLPPAEGDERSRIIVVSPGQEDRVGLFVDRVRGVVRFPASAVRPAPETVEQGAEFLLGIARRDDRLLILLDAEKTTGT